MRYAIIIDNIVVQTEPAPRPGLVEIPDHVCPGYLHQAGTFTPPPPPAATIADVKAEAARRITATGLAWMVEREVSGGAPIPPAVREQCAAIRAASNTLEAATPIPPDYRADHHWPA